MADFKITGIIQCMFIEKLREGNCLHQNSLPINGGVADELVEGRLDLYYIFSAS